ncbi:DNA polymerase III subunit gamma/tau [Haliea atlantica]
MSYQVLARKWRPSRFSELVGQEHVRQALVNALDHDRLHHAYLFTGTRGVGKTTIARIFAKSLNCEAGVSSEPCGRCSACEEIAQGRSVDLLEIDAASRTKVEDTRELLDNVQYAPTRSRFKVYLIDEVHMLSNSSFNALLKTLEEPPPHVKFLLATTDPQKLPATVLSRCLQFNLKNMLPEQVVGHLRQVLETEMIPFEEPALWLLARAADGSMRDALSLTDQAIAFGSGSVHEAQVRSMLGTVDTHFVLDLLRALAEGEPGPVLDIVARMAEHAPDFAASLDEMLSVLHQLAVQQFLPGSDRLRGDAPGLAELAGRLSAEDVQLWYQMALQGKRDLPWAADPRSGFEMSLLRMLAFRPAMLPPGAFEDDRERQAAGEGSPGGKKPAEPTPVPVSAPAQRLPPTPAEPSTAPAATTAPAPAAAGAAPVAPALSVRGPPAPPSTSTPPPASSTLRPAPAGGPDAGADEAEDGEPAEAPDLDTLAGDWPALLESLGLVGIVYNIALHCELRAWQGADFQFVLDERHAALYNSGHDERLRKALELRLEQPVTVKITLGAVAGETPAQRQQRLAAQRQQEAEREVDQDPLLKHLIARFDGRLDRSSIAPVDTQEPR